MSKPNKWAVVRISKEVPPDKIPRSSLPDGWWLALIPIRGEGTLQHHLAMMPATGAYI